MIPDTFLTFGKIKSFLVSNGKEIDNGLFTLCCNGKLLVADKPLVMGIINVTPDSFYIASRFMRTDELIAQAGKMLNDGAAIIDLGGQSTRPGSVQVGAAEETDRLLPAVEALHTAFPDAIFSVDTFYASVAAAAVQAGAGMVNDISGGSLDSALIETVGRLGVPYVCMHMKGIPATMHHQPGYDNIVKEVVDYFISMLAVCKKAGIHDVIIDPGFGFGKTAAHNLLLIKELSVFSILQKPLLVGISRKSTVYKTLGVTAAEALNGTTVLHTICLMNGANILRVHDVKEAVEAVTLVRSMLNISL